MSGSTQELKMEEKKKKRNLVCPSFRPRHCKKKMKIEKPVRITCPSSSASN